MAVCMFFGRKRHPRRSGRLNTPFTGGLCRHWPPVDSAWATSVPSFMDRFGRFHGCRDCPCSAENGPQGVEKPIVWNTCFSNPQFGVIEQQFILEHCCHCWQFMFSM